MEGQVGVGCEGGGSGDGGGADRQNRQLGVVVGMAEECDAVPAAGSGVYAFGHDYTVHL